MYSTVEVEEGQILSFTRGQVTVWNAVQKTTESSFTLDKGKDVSYKIYISASERIEDLADLS